jgi:aspartate aminotransferase/aminotransferase
LARNVLVVPGKTFSSRDTHFRISYATPMKKLEEGLTVLSELLRG